MAIQSTPRNSSEAISEKTSEKTSIDTTGPVENNSSTTSCGCKTDTPAQPAGNAAARAFGSALPESNQQESDACGCSTTSQQQEIPLSSVISGGCACMQAAPKESSGTVCNPDLCDCNDSPAGNSSKHTHPSPAAAEGKLAAEAFGTTGCGCSSGATSNSTIADSASRQSDTSQSDTNQSGAMAASMFEASSPTAQSSQQPAQGSFASQAFSGTMGTANAGKNLSEFSGGCACSQEKQKAQQPKRSPAAYAILGTLLLGFWFALYWQLQPLAEAVTNALPIEKGSHLFEAVAFFLYDTPKVLMLLSLVVFGVGVLRTWVTPERTRKYLAGRRESVGNVLAALLGVVTPFCSCSAVPLFLGFVAAGVPLGVTFSFLIAAPMVNEIALVLLYGLFGFKVAAIYFGTGVLIAIVAGWILGRMNLEHLLESWVKQVRDDGVNNGPRFTSFLDRVDFGLASVKDIVGKTWKYVLVGIAAGAAIHGYVPEGFMAGIMGREAWWSVPAAVVLGIPMYANAAGIIPVVSALLGKGAAMGTVLAFMMSVVALSFPEMVILRKVLSVRLIALFVGIVGLGILGVGYLFNMIM